MDASKKARSGLGEGSLAPGLRAWHEGRFFDAHEAWEDVWRRTTDPPVRTALQGLIQLAAALHKARLGHAAGHHKLWRKARNRIAAGAEALGEVHGLDLTRLLEALPEDPPDPSYVPPLPAGFDRGR